MPHHALGGVARVDGPARDIDAEGVDKLRARQQRTGVNHGSYFMNPDHGASLLAKRWNRKIRSRA